MIWVTAVNMRMPNKYKRILMILMVMIILKNISYNNYNTHLKSDNDDRDEENQMESETNTINSNEKVYDNWDHNKKYEHKL